MASVAARCCDRDKGRALTHAIPIATVAAQSARVDVCFHKRGEDQSDGTDLVTVEEPLEIRLGYHRAGEHVEQSIAVTMRTPGDDFALTRGFLLGEGVIRGAGDVAAIAFCGPPSPDKGLHNVVKATLAPDVRFDADRLLRHVFTSSSCGVCGKASLDAVRVQMPDIERPPVNIDATALGSLPAALRAKQAEFVRTGGLHAAAAFDASGRIRRVREDVGRHNALDKLIGSYLEPSAGEREELAPRMGEPSAGVREGPAPRMNEPAPLRGLGVLLSGRASFELIQKAAMTHAALVASIGPPSSLAIELAAEAGISLVGFLKAETFNVYV